MVRKGNSSGGGHFRQNAAEDARQMAIFEKLARIFMTVVIRECHLMSIILDYAALHYGYGTADLHFVM